MGAARQRTGADRSTRPRDGDVFGDLASAVADAEKRPEPNAAAIAYLKEQQWTNPFATIQVREGDVRTSIRVPAAIEPVTGGEAIVAAPADGRYSVSAICRRSATASRRANRWAGSSRAWPKAATITPRLPPQSPKRRPTLEGARAELARAERLLAERAVPARRVDDARRATTIAEARLTAAQARLAQRDQVLGSGGGAASGNAFVLRAPIAGRLAEVFASLGRLVRRRCAALPDRSRPTKSSSRRRCPWRMSRSRAP